MRRSWVCLYMVVVATGCGGRPIPLTSDGSVTPDGLVETLTSDGGAQDGFCQGSTAKLIVNESTVPGAYSPSHANTTGGSLYLSMQLRSSGSEGAAVAYYFVVSGKGATGKSATLPLTLDLAALPPSWQVSASKTHCSPGGTDSCQILGQLDSQSGDLFSGSVQVTGTSLSALDRVTICATGRPAEQPTHSPVMSLRLYLSKKL